MCLQSLFSSTYTPYVTWPDDHQDEIHIRMRMDMPKKIILPVAPPNKMWMCHFPNALNGQPMDDQTRGYPGGVSGDFGATSFLDFWDIRIVSEEEMRNIVLQKRIKKICVLASLVIIPSMIVKMVF